MKLIKHEKTNDYTMELEMLLEPEQYTKAVSKVYRRDAKKYNVPGFRRGHAPKNLIEKAYGKDVFMVDAVNELFPDAFQEAIKELGMEPVARPEADIVSFSDEDGVTLKITSIIKPDVKVGNYVGLKGTRVVGKVDEARVDAEIERMQERNARIITRDGAAQDGDIATLDYEGSVDGVPFEGGKDEGHKLTLGSGQFIPGFEEKVVGHSAGEEFDIDVKFPEEYHSEELKGKDAVFHIKLNEVQYKELPELDDEFAKDVSEYDTLDELKKSIRDGMQKELDEKSDMDTENELVAQIVETMEGEIPDAMFENRVDEMVNDFNFRLQQQGLNLPTYLQYTGQDMDAFRAGFNEQAEKVVKMRLALEAVVRQEGIEATPEDIEEEVGNIAEKYSMEKDKVRELMPEEEIAKDLAVNKALKYISSKAEITEKTAEETEAEKAAETEDGEDKPKKAAKPKKTTKKAAKRAEDDAAEEAPAE